MAIGGLVLLVAGRGPAGAAVAVLFLALTLVVKPHATRYIARTTHWIGGARAEEAVGTALEELRREGWILMHDVPQRGEGNIDHIASGPNGVYLVETKLRRYEPEHLPKVKRQAAKLHDELAVWVTPVVCLHERDQQPFRASGVWIVPRPHLLRWLRAQRNPPVDFERLARFADRVDSALEWQ